MRLSSAKQSERSRHRPCSATAAARCQIGGESREANAIHDFWEGQTKHQRVVDRRAKKHSRKSPPAINASVATGPFTSSFPHVAAFPPAGTGGADTLDAEFNG